jgi:thioredoxin reductase
MSAQEESNATVDSVVIGAGVAGLAAALFLARAGLRTLVYDGGPSRIMSVSRIREYLGFDGQSPSDMLRASRAEVVRHGAEIRQASVTQVDARIDGLFDVWTGDDKVCARTIVLATGLRDALPDVEGVGKTWGDDLRVCPCFDGAEVRNKRFVVFGVQERIAHMSRWVSMWSDKVTLVAEAPLPEVDQESLRLLNIPVVIDEVVGLIHERDQVVAVKTASGSDIECDAAWVSLPCHAASDLARSLCDVDAFGLARVDDSGRTSRPGVFAVGNAVASGAAFHLAHAAASGTHVGPIVTLHLLESRLASLRAGQAA